MAKTKPVRCRAKLGGQLLFPGRFLDSEEDVPQDGTDRILTIASVQIEALASERGEEMRATVTFRDEPKKLVLNKTNAAKIAGMLGDRVEDWRGKRISLYAAHIETGIYSGPAIRVRDAAPTGAQRTNQAFVAAAPPDDDPAMWTQDTASATKAAILAFADAHKRVLPDMAPEHAREMWARVTGIADRGTWTRDTYEQATALLLTVESGEVTLHATPEGTWRIVGEGDSDVTILPDDDQTE